MNVTAPATADSAAVRVAPFRAGKLPTGDIASINLLASRRLAPRFDLLGAPLVVEGVRPVDGDAVGPESLRLLIRHGGGEETMLCAPAALIGRMLDALQPGLVLPPDDPTLPLLLEYILAEVFDTAEKRLGEPLTVVGVMPPADRPRRPALQVAFRLDGVPHSAVLAPAAQSPGDFAALLRRSAVLARLAAPAPRADAELIGITVPIAIEIGRVLLTLDELRGLAVADVLLPDTAWLARGVARLRISRRGHAEVSISGRSVRLEARPTFDDEPEERTMLDKPTEEEGPDDGGIEDIEVQLVFEVGRQSVEIGKLRTLDEGSVIELSSDPAQSIAIVANGRTIGRGELVSVGDTLGVRIIRLFGSGT